MFGCKPLLAVSNTKTSVLIYLAVASTYYNNGYDIFCYLGTLRYYNNQKKDEQQSVEESTVGKRVTYAACPVSGFAYQVCCPSPKSCHTGATASSVCY